MFFRFAVLPVCFWIFVQVLFNDPLPSGMHLVSTHMNLDCGDVAGAEQGGRGVGGKVVLGFVEIGLDLFFMQGLGWCQWCEWVYAGDSGGGNHQVVSNKNSTRGKNRQQQTNK